MVIRFTLFMDIESLALIPTIVLEKEEDSFWIVFIVLWLRFEIQFRRNGYER